ncbi:MAG TPA: hypothetical protein VGE76_05695 [Opitutaceae bacterium]
MKRTGRRHTWLPIGLGVAFTLVAIVASALAVPRVFSIAIALTMLLLVVIACCHVFDRACSTSGERMVVLVCVALLIGIVAINWPLLLSHRLARPQLEELARQARAGVAPAQMPLRVGLFRIEAIEVRQRGRREPQYAHLAAMEPGATDLRSIVIFWLSRRHETLLAQCAVSRPMFNVFTMDALDDRWVFVMED